MLLFVVVAKERELLESLETESENSKKIRTTFPQNSITNELLSTMQQQQHVKEQQTTVQQLSPAAKQIITQLPDWSFMKAKVLMFPIKNDVTGPDT